MIYDIFFRKQKWKKSNRNKLPQEPIFKTHPHSPTTSSLFLPPRLSFRYSQPHGPISRQISSKSNTKHLFKTIEKRPNLVSQSVFSHI